MWLIFVCTIRLFVTLLDYRFLDSYINKCPSKMCPSAAYMLLWRIWSNIALFSIAPCKVISLNLLFFWYQFLAFFLFYSLYSYWSSNFRRKENIQNWNKRIKGDKLCYRKVWRKIWGVIENGQFECPPIKKYFVFLVPKYYFRRLYSYSRTPWPRPSPPGG